MIMMMVVMRMMVMMMMILIVDFAPCFVDLTTRKCGLDTLLLT